MELTIIEIVGILEGAIIVLILLAAWKLFRMFGNPKKMTTEEIEKNGVLAEAIVLNVNETGLYINDLPQVKLQVQVQPDKGRNFVAEVQQVIPNAEKEPLHAGSRLIVKFDPGNRKEVIVLSAIS